MKKNKTKQITTQYVLDITIHKQTEITYIRYATCLTLDFNTKLSNYLFIGRKTEIIQKREKIRQETKGRWRIELEH
jgi:hypothetical protein